jgi:penicillin-binding protein-related factor A (putative recombinase)
MVKMVDKRAQGKRNHKNGDKAQDIGERVMRDLGFKMVERVETGFKVIRSGSRITGAFPCSKVSGDIRAVGNKGQAVLAEVKYREGKLKWSDFEKHQLESMQAITEDGGAAFVVWVASFIPERVYMLHWPFQCLKKGRAITERECTDFETVEYFGIRSKEAVR